MSSVPLGGNVHHAFAPLGTGIAYISDILGSEAEKRQRHIVDSIFRLLAFIFVTNGPHFLAFQHFLHRYVMSDFFWGDIFLSLPPT